MFDRKVLEGGIWTNIERYGRDDLFRELARTENVDERGLAACLTQTESVDPHRRDEELSSYEHAIQKSQRTESRGDRGGKRGTSRQHLKADDGNFELFGKEQIAEEVDERCEEEDHGGRGEERMVGAG